MKSLVVKIKENFIGRKQELAKLKAISSSGDSSIIVVYGRRRIGKTELLEQSFKDRNLLKFEGIEGLTEKEQFANVMSQFATYIDDPLMSKLAIETWSEFFQLLAKYTKNGEWTIYLEELQWLANYKGNLISELKYVWDNYFRHNAKLIIILCGSAPSFMLEQVVHSRALYNRSQYEINLREFNLLEAKAFLKGRSHREVFDAYLTVGGVPEYLKWVNKDSSVFLSLCQNSFVSGSFFAREYEKIFTSSMSKNKYYKDTIEILSKQKFSSRTELMKKLKVVTGGSMTNVLIDLQKSGFISKYTPFNASENTLLCRYMICDNYLQFYFKFIKPLQRKIDSGDFDSNPKVAINTNSYNKWLGFAFERWCRKYHYVIAKILGFSGVQYRSGVYFSRATNKENPGYQLDLIFDRADNVYTVCEIKYLQGKVGTNVINEYEKKLVLFPNKDDKTIHRVLITMNGAESGVLDRAYFDEVITCTELFNENNW